MKIDRESASAFEGIALVEIRKADAGVSKKKQKYIRVSLVSVQTGDVLGTDIYMLEGKGVWMMLPKLIALGLPEEIDDVEPHHLLGRRAYVAFKSEMDEYMGFPKSVPDTTASGSQRGYWSESTPPPGFDPNAIASLEFGEGDDQHGVALDTPF